MLLSLSTYFRCLMPPSASNASSWATKNIVSRHEVKTYLGKSLKTTAFPVHCTLSLPKSHIWWFCRMSLDEGVLLQEQTCLQSLHLFKLGQVAISAPFSCQLMSKARKLGCPFGQAKCTPTMHGIWQYPHLFKRFKPRFWWMKVGTKILPLIRLCACFNGSALFTTLTFCRCLQSTTKHHVD